MIDRVYFKNNISFDEAQLLCDDGLMVLSGASGAGKSVVFKSILSVFGLFDVSASLVEVSCDDSIDIPGIDSEPHNSFKAVKDKQTRYFINNQSISKKSIKAPFIKYLSARNYEDFNHSSILSSIDRVCAACDAGFDSIMQEYKECYDEYKRAKSQLDELSAKQEQINDKKEFLSYEISKIESIAPKDDEYDELMQIKTKLSKKDKIDSAKARAMGILDYERYVVEFLRLSGVDEGFFIDCIEELKSQLQDSTDYDEYDIEAVLDRLEKLNYLVKKYGDLKSANQALQDKKQELSRYENIDFEKSTLKHKLKECLDKANSLATKLSAIRQKHTKLYEKRINEYLSKLYLKGLSLSIVGGELGASGADSIELDLLGASLKNISFGELNRLRLAFLASECSFVRSASGVIFLDEIDANLSGKEAGSVADVLVELSAYYQIFAITHLPSLSAKAKKHFVVEKSKEGKSIVRELDKQGQIQEIARMISGAKLSKQALEFAKSLLGGDV